MRTFKKLISNFKKQDAATKIGLLILIGFILPVCISMFAHVLSNSATITLGSF